MLQEAGLHEAVSVLGRTLGWLARDQNAARVRFVEGNLRVWAARAAEAAPQHAELQALLAALDGLDAAGPDERTERARRLREHLDAARATLGEAPPEEIEERVQLLPDGIDGDRAPRAPEPPPPPTEPVAVPPPVRTERREPAQVERAEPPPAPRSVAPVVEREPEPPPSWPLADPHASGQPVASLRVFDQGELERLSAVGIESVADLLQRAPTEYERAGERFIPGVPPDGPVIVRGRVGSRITRFRRGFRVFELQVSHDRADVRCRWMGPVPEEVLAARAGSEMGLAGTLAEIDGQLLLHEPEPLGMDGRGGDWLPRYGLEQLPDARVRAGVRAALRAWGGNLLDHLSPELRDKVGLLPLGPALRDAHFPSNAARKGRARMVFDELLQIQLGVALARSPAVRERGTAVPVTHGLVARALAAGGWSMTDEQEMAFDTIRRDLRRSTPTARLIQGDVGSGKSVVVRAAMLVVAESRLQCFFVATDAVAAEHHAMFAAEFFQSAGVEVMTLTGPPTRTQAEAIRKGDALVIYGPPSLLRDPPEVRKLGLLVVENTTVHGVPDTSALEAAGQRPDVLVLTPTPVPSLLAVTVYGRLAMTVMTSGPSRGVDTHVLPAAERDRAWAAAREALSAKQQVILAFPLAKGRDLLSPSEARRLAEFLSREALPDARIAIFNGDMSREERFRAYDDFQHRRADVLLATSVMEDGPPVPDASVLIVEHADQLDLVRLHRLRGHVGRGWRRAQCFLVMGEEPTPAAEAVLRMVSEVSDGFRIADLDLARRGARSALADDEEVPAFSWADPVEDRETLNRARQEAHRLLATDPGLKRRSNRGLLNLVRLRAGEDIAPDAGPPPTGPHPADHGGRGRKRRRRR
jgi:ATP-dependent DNA helicase RecG